MNTRSIALDFFSLSGQTVLITGAAGSLGAVLAREFYGLGCEIILLDRNLDKLKQLSAELREKEGPDVSHICLDLENETERTLVLEFIYSRNKNLDILINNAAFVGDNSLKGWVTPFVSQSVETWRRAIEVNLTSCFHLCQLLTPALQASGKGSIVNIGSIYGHLGPDLSLYFGTNMGNPAAYAASKGGLIQLTRWLATVLAPDIRVNCVSPGGIARNQDPNFIARYESRTPLKRMGTEEDMVGAVVYFASQLSRYTTGQNLVVDGGWSAW